MPPRFLLLYNQFPYDYRNIGEMTRDLSRISSMGFNAVWINPIQKTEIGAHPVNWLKGKHTGSLYAMHDPDRIDEAFRVSEREEDNTATLQLYTHTACEHYLTPIFDLVLNQVALDCVLCKVHPDWFKPSVHFGKGCLDFNYDNGDIEAEIITFWKGYIDKYILIYGFMGVRVDAVKHVPIRVQRVLYEHIWQRCDEKYKVAPIIFAELLLSPDECGMLDSLIAELRDARVTHITHVTNTAYWDVTRREQRRIPGFLDDMGKKSQIAPTVGFAASHDTLTLYGSLIESLARQETLAEKHIQMQKFMRICQDIYTEIMEKLRIE